MADFEKDVGEWRRLNSSNLIPFVEEELECLSEYIQKIYAETQELKSLEIEKVKIADAIDASNSALANANEQLEKMEAMIKKANFLISKVRPMCAEEIAG